MPFGITAGNQITLGAIMDGLKKAEPGLPVYFDWCRLNPGRFCSYRGYYEDLALGFEDSRYKSVTVGELLQACEEIEGKILEGWKGGDYKMTRETPVWVANSGQSTGWAIVGVDVDEYRVILKTQLVD